MANSNDFYKNYKRYIDYLNKAKEYYLKNETEDCLANCRRCLEGMLKSFCNECGIETEGITNENMIDILMEKDIFTRDEAGTLHKARQLGNKGTHVGNEAPTKNEADLALRELEKAMKIFEAKENKEKFSSVNAEENVPMHNPDYYSVNRKYRGIFADVFNINQLKIDDTYKKLYAAAEGGDIQAMLDLAISFLPKQFKGKYAINDNKLFNLPLEHNNDNQDYAYDYRYYYWIIRAAKQAAEYYAHEKSDLIPYKYIATVLFEACLFEFYGRFGVEYKAVLRYENGTPAFFDNYTMIIEWYGAFPFILDEKPLFSMLKELVEQYGCDIIDSFFDEISITDIKYMNYCYLYYYRLKNYDYLANIYEETAIDEGDKDKQVTIDVLKKYAEHSSFTKKLYFQVNDKEEKIKQEEQRKQEEEQRKQEEQKVNGSNGVYFVPPALR